MFASRTTPGLLLLAGFAHAGLSTPAEYQPFNDLVIDTNVCCEYDDQFLTVGMNEVRVAFHWNISAWDNPPYKARMTFVRNEIEIGSYTGAVQAQLGLGSFAVPFDSPLTEEDLADDHAWSLFVYIVGGINESNPNDADMPWESRIASDVRYHFEPTTTESPVTSEPTPTPTTLSPATSNPTPSPSLGPTTEPPVDPPTNLFTEPDEGEDADAENREGDGVSGGYKSSKLASNQAPLSNKQAPSSNSGTSKGGNAANRIDSDISGSKGAKIGYLVNPIAEAHAARTPVSLSTSFVVLCVGIIALATIALRKKMAGSDEGEKDDVLGEYAYEVSTPGREQRRWVTIDGQQQPSPSRPTEEGHDTSAENTAFGMVLQSYGTMLTR